MIALILARGGSKRVPNKNIKKLNGKPLINYVIEAAKESSHISNVYVSTDSEKIKKVALQAGVKVIDRPDELATDSSIDKDAFIHFVNELGYSGNIAHLRATTPLIEGKVLDQAIEFFLDNESDCTAMRSAHELSRSSYKTFSKDGKFWKGLFSEEEWGKEYYNLPNQAFPKTYAPNGYIDIVKTETFMNSDTFHGNKILSFETDFVPEIDTEEDFSYLASLLRCRQ